MMTISINTPNFGIAKSQMVPNTWYSVEEIQEEKPDATAKVICELSALALLGVGVYCLVKKGEVNSKTNEFVDNIEKNNAFVKTIQDKLSKEWEAVKNLKGDYEKRNGKYAQLTI